MAIEELKKSNNSTLYKQIMEKVASDKLGNAINDATFLFSLGSLDQAWMDAVDKKAAQQQERLEMELNGYKTNLIKESIRVYPHFPICFSRLPDGSQRFR
jgi:COP9 signalosome complex subunit 1